MPDSPPPCNETSKSEEEPRRVLFQRSQRLSQSLSGSGFECASGASTIEFSAYRSPVPQSVSVGAGRETLNSELRRVASVYLSKFASGFKSSASVRDVIRPMLQRQKQSARARIGARIAGRLSEGLARRSGASECVAVVASASWAQRVSRPVALQSRSELRSEFPVAWLRSASVVPVVASQLRH